MTEAIFGSKGELKGLTKGKLWSKVVHCGDFSQNHQEGDRVILKNSGGGHNGNRAYSFLFSSYYFSFYIVVTLPKVIRKYIY